MVRAPAIAAAIALTCSPVLAAGVPPTEPSVRLFPAVGEETVAELGQPMATRESVLNATTLRLLDSARTKSIKGNSVDLPAGEYTLGKATSKGRYYYNPRVRLRAFGLASDAPYGAGIFVPTGDNPKPGAFWESAFGALEGDAPDLRVEVGMHSGYRRELVYGGVAQGVLNVSYREFVNDLARPAFTQDLRYDLAAGREIGFRGARIEVLEAGNTSVRFKLLKPLDEPAPSP